MEHPPDPNLDLRKDIAADAAEPEEKASIFTKVGQFFLVPLAIVTVCVGLIAFFQYMTSEPGSARDLITDIRGGGAVSRKHAALQLVQVVGDQARKGRLDPALFDPLLSLFNDLPSNSTPADPVTQRLVGEGPSMRALLARCLSFYRDPRAVDPILRAMKDERNSETLAAYLDSLGTIGSPEAAPELIKLLDHPSTVVKKYAAFNLAVVAAPRKDGRGGDSDGAPSAIPHLHRKLNDAGERDEVRWNAALGLAMFLNDPAGRDVLLRMLDRAHLEQVIGADKNEKHVAELVAHAMTQACHAAGALKDAKFQPALEKVGQDPDSNVRAAARRAMDLISKR
jgi:HEAT repeat protein